MQLIFISLTLLGSLAVTSASAYGYPPASSKESSKSIKTVSAVSSVHGKSTNSSLSTSTSRSKISASSTGLVSPTTSATSNSTQTRLSLRLFACPDKAAEEEQLLLNFVEQVRANEPGVLEFLIYYNPANTSFQTLEKYADDAAIAYHLSTPWYNELIDAEIAGNTKCAPNMVSIPLDTIFELVRPGVPIVKRGASIMKRAVQPLRTLTQSQVDFYAWAQGAFEAL